MFQALGRPVSPDSPTLLSLPLAILRLGGAHVRQYEVHHVLDNGRGRVEIVGEMMGHGHFPGIHKNNTQAHEHGPEHPVELQHEPVAVVQAHVRVQGL